MASNKLVDFRPFLESLNKRPNDPLMRVLAAVGRREQTIPELVADTRLPLDQLYDCLKKLEEMGLLSRREVNRSQVISINPDGMTLLEGVGRS